MTSFDLAIVTLTLKTLFGLYRRKFILGRDIKGSLCAISCDLDLTFNLVTLTLEIV